jgi:hypothetical protein
VIFHFEVVGWLKNLWRKNVYFFHRPVGWKKKPPQIMSATGIWDGKKTLWARFPPPESEMNKKSHSIPMTSDTTNGIWDGKKILASYEHHRPPSPASGMKKKAPRGLAEIRSNPNLR